MDALGLFIETDKDYPVCNHTGAKQENIGYTAGILSDGNPFEAECWVSGDTVSLGIIMPYIEEFHEIPEAVESSTVVGFKNEVEIVDNSILDIGMVDGGEEECLEIVEKYIDYLCYLKVIEFCSNIYNGTLQYRIDSLGNSLVNVKITLSDSYMEYAETSLTFRPFKRGKVKLRLV